MRCIRHAFGILGLAAGALFPVGGLIGLIGLAAGWDGDPDLGRSGMAVVSAAYLCIALVFGAIGIGVWPPTPPLTTRRVRRSGSEPAKAGA